MIVADAFVEVRFLPDRSEAATAIFGAGRERLEHQRAGAHFQLVVVLG